MMELGIFTCSKQEIQELNNDLVLLLSTPVQW